MEARPTVSGVSEPKQQRSRDSFAKVCAAVLDLLHERGTGQFSLAEVSARAGVSIGSIYGRVAGKAELLRAVQSQEFDRLDLETAQRVSIAAAGATDFAGATTAIVTAYAELLRENRDLLAPFFLLGVEDAALLDRGRQSGDAGQQVFLRALIAAAEEHGVDLPDAKARWAFEVFYSLSVRYLGLGVTATASPHDAYGWRELLERLAHTVFLMTAPE
ncbi:helix-turn-helix domain containing protein [Microbacterium sp. SL62]|uniref:TetR/AcrR family transcriptional regulator n=1 Tax=Microbacterium sp. SL62 TaxID=2995139 RepID=UPI0022754677|nr:TetR/AcrR family transcriptional regulator [Microbacterium sp. SL62]MCY1715659.1 helix-turn-helix domain containing protein [Microbacterium sp. SL62]